MESYFARQPIFDLWDNTVAYELLYRKTPVPAPYSENDGDMSTAEVINSSFFGGEPEFMFDGKRAFVNFTENHLLSKTALLLPKDTLVIEILETVEATDEILQACRDLKEQEYTIALDDYELNDGTEPFLEIADIVKIDFLNSTKEVIEKTAKICREKKIKILAEKLETKEMVEYAKSLGAVYFQGYYYERPLIVTAQGCTPMAQTFFRLMGIIHDDKVDFKEISEIIEQDAAMTLKLLRLVNALRMDSAEQISSVMQAVQLIGLRRTREWVHLMGLQRIKTDAPDETITRAFFRAKFCESLAMRIIRRKKESKEYYLMGLMSAIIDLKSKDSNAIMNKLSISDNIKAALSGENQGMFYDVLNVVVSYEKAEWEVVDHFNATYGTDENVLANDYVECIKATEELMKMV